jgi:hypothetical protein
MAPIPVFVIIQADISGGEDSRGARPTVIDAHTQSRLLDDTAQTFESTVEGIGVDLVLRRHGRGNKSKAHRKHARSLNGENDRIRNVITMRSRPVMSV